MPTSVRLDSGTESLLNRLARKSGKTRSAVIRDAIALLARTEAAKPAALTPYERMKGLIGRGSGGPTDLSERAGEKFTGLLLGRTRR